MVMMSRFHREERGSIPRKGIQQDGAEEACLAHNQEVDRSKLSPATLYGRIAQSVERSAVIR